MAKTKSRKPDLRKIQTTRSYTTEQVSKRLKRTKSTVNVWIREGLPTLPDTNPKLIDGAVLKIWLQKKWRSRKHKCRVNELYCCKCRKPQIPSPQTITYTPSNAFIVFIKAECSLCGSKMHQARSARTMTETLQAMRMITSAKENLSENKNTIVKPTIWTGQTSFDFHQVEKGNNNVH